MFPEDGKVHVIFSYFKNNQVFKASVQKLLSYDDQKIKLLLSSFLISNILNVGTYSIESISLFKDSYTSLFRCN